AVRSWFVLEAHQAADAASAPARWDAVLGEIVLDATDAPDAASALASLRSNVDLTAGEAQDTVAITAGIRSWVLLDANEAADIFVASANVPLGALLGATEASDTGWAKAFVADFFYGDSEIMYVPWERQSLMVAPEVRLMTIPAVPPLHELTEYREMTAPARRRA